MALTKVTGHVVKPDTNIQFHNTKSTGIVTFAHTSNATSSTTGALQITGGVGIVKDLHVGGNVTVGGTLTYDDVTNIDSLGIITARGGINVSGGTLTVANNTDLNGDLDVDGHTELDNLNVAGVSTFNDDVTFIDGYGNSNHVVYDKSITSLKFPSGIVAGTQFPAIIFGDRTSGGNTKLYNDWHNTHFRHFGAGNFVISTFTNAIQIGGANGSGGTQTSIYIPAGATEGVKLYQANQPRFETVGYGVTVLGTTETQKLNVTGISTFVGDAKVGSGITFHATNSRISLPDGTTGSPFTGNFEIGNSRDFTIVHDSNHTYMTNRTGNFYIGISDSVFPIQLKSNNTVEIYHGSTKRLETDSLGINVLGRLDVSGTGANDHLNLDSNTTRLRIGGYADLQLYHDSTNINYISNHNDVDLHVTSTYGGTPTKTQAKFIHDGAVELYHNNNLRLQTWSDAVNVLGDNDADAILHLYADRGDDNADKWMLRAESSAQRFSIENYSTGSWVENIRITAGGLVELKHADGTTKMHTDTTGITVANRITASGDTNTYINLGSSADTLDFYTGGSNYFRLNSDGNLLVNKLTTSDKGRFEVKGPTSDDIETSDISAKTIATFSGSTPGTTAAGKGAGIVIKPISDRGCNYFLGVAGDSANQESHGRFIIRSGNFYNQSIERLRILANGNIKFATDNSSTDYLQWGNNPRLYLKCPDGINGLRIDANTTPLEIRRTNGDGRSISIGGGANFDMSISGDYSLSSSGYDSSPKLFLNTTRHNGSTTVTSFQTAIQAVATSNTNNTGYLGLGASASPNNLTIHTTGHIGINANDVSGLSDNCKVLLSSTFRNDFRNGSGRGVERGFYGMNTGSGSVDYFHMKTDMATNSGCMFLFTLRGYAYGQGKVMFAQTCGYCYSATNTIINTENKSWDGHTVLSTYKSSDGYVVLRAYLPSWSSYYSGFVIDVSYQNPATGSMKYKVTAASAQLTSSDYYA